VIFSRPLEHLSNQSTPIGQHGFQTFTLRILFETFVEVYFTKTYYYTFRNSVFPRSLPRSHCHPAISRRHHTWLQQWGSRRAISDARVDSLLYLKMSLVHEPCVWSEVELFSLSSFNANKDGEIQRRGRMASPHSLVLAYSKPENLFGGSKVNLSTITAAVCTHIVHCRCTRPATITVVVESRFETRSRSCISKSGIIIWIGEAWSSQFK
jgi:hypothetical protein